MQDQKWLGVKMLAEDPGISQFVNSDIQSRRIPQQDVLKIDCKLES